jgi:hypothetical protein
MSTIGTIALVTLLSGGHAESSPSVRCTLGPERRQVVCCSYREGVKTNCKTTTHTDGPEQQQMEEELRRKADELRRRLKQEQTEE